MTVTRERTPLLAGIGVLVLTGLLVGTAVLADRNYAPQGEWLMVMKAEQAEFAEAPNGNYTLTLTDIAPMTLAVTDRPERTAQTWDTTVVLDYWESEFGPDPPNAAVTADGVGVVVTLSDPRIGMSERSDETVTPTRAPSLSPPHPCREKCHPPAPSTSRLSSWTPSQVQ